MAFATASASVGSSASPRWSVACRRLKTSFGRRLRWTARVKTVSPNRELRRLVRSDAPSAAPLAVRWAAVTFCWRVLAMGVTGPPSLLECVECVSVQRRGYGRGGGGTLSTGRNIPRAVSPPRKGSLGAFDPREKPGRRSLARGRMPGRRPRPRLAMPLDHGGPMLRRRSAIGVLGLSALIVLLAP